MQNPDEDTVWNDVLRDKGILPPKKELEVTEEQILSLVEQAVAEKTRNRDIDELELNELDELEDDMLLDEDERVLEEYRQKRIAEMQALHSRQLFGTVDEISQVEFVKEVTEASAKVWVGVFLYKPGMPACSLMAKRLEYVARKYKTVKFVKIIGDHCIPNYPDRNLPTLLVYGEGDLKRQHVGLAGLGGMNMQVGDLVLLLKNIGAIEKQSQEDANDMFDNELEEEEENKRRQNNYDNDSESD